MYRRLVIHALIDANLSKQNFAHALALHTSKEVPVINGAHTPTIARLRPDDWVDVAILMTAHIICFFFIFLDMML